MEKIFEFFPYQHPKNLEKFRQIFRKNRQGKHAIAVSRSLGEGQGHRGQKNFKVKNFFSIFYAFWTFLSKKYFPYQNPKFGLRKILTNFREKIFLLENARNCLKCIKNWKKIFGIFPYQHPKRLRKIWPILIMLSKESNNSFGRRYPQSQIASCFIQVGSYCCLYYLPGGIILQTFWPIFGSCLMSEMSVGKFKVICYVKVIWRVCHQL